MNYISTYLDHQRRLLEESVTRFLTEGKHWPQDYLRTSFDKLKKRFPGIPDDDIKKAIVKVQQAIDSIPAAHEGTWIQWHPKWWSILDFIASKAGEGFQTFDEVKNLIDSTLPKIVKGLPVLDASSDLDCQPSAIKIKSFEDFLQTIDKAIAASREVNAGQNGSEYEVVPISSWQQMNKLYGRKTGLNGDGGWCHTEGESTWNNWTKNGSRAFFVIERKDWRSLKAPDPKTVPTAFDDYGMSLIAILVDIMTEDLKAETLRWNHKKAPPLGESYVDHAFEDSWEKLDKAVGLDVKSICYEHIAEAERKIEQMKARTNAFIKQFLQNAIVIDADTIPNGHRQYATHIVIPDSVTSIGEDAFGCCSSLTNVVIPDSVTSIDDSAFNWCTSLTSIAIPDSVTSIGDYAFYGCESLKSIVIPDSVKNIGRSVFNDCKSLTSISIPNSVEIIENSMFYRCQSLKSIAIPDSIKRIGNWAFCECSSLTSISIPGSVTSIGEDAFCGCGSLTSISIPDSVQSIEDFAFSSCSSLTSIVIPSSVKSIGDSVFGNCKSLTSIAIPESVESIRDYAFINCKSLTSITIPDSVTSIGAEAFYNCTSLTSISIPDSVKSIGDDAFRYCTNLTSIVFKGKTIKEVKSMSNCPWGADTSKTEIIAEFE